MPNATAFPPFGEGFSVVSIDSDADTLRIEWEPDPWHLPPEQLPTTLFVSPRVLDAANPRFADAGGLALLHVRLRRLSCSRCGQRVERISWLQRRARLTRRLADAVALWCARLPTRHVAEMFGLHWSSVRLFERRALEATLITLPAPQPKRLMMDEFALYKGHRYARVVLDAEAQCDPLDRRGAQPRSYSAVLRELGPAGCARIDVGAMDMNTAFDLEVRQRCPNAWVVYDLFHVVAKCDRELIDRVRVDEANRLRHDKPARRVIKQARWLLLRNPENLHQPEQQVHLQELLNANQTLMTVYLMKAQLKALWIARSAWQWRAAWRQWRRHAQESQIPAPMLFAKRLSSYWRGILSRVRWPMHTGQLEGINNRIKVIKPMAMATGTVSVSS